MLRQLANLQKYKTAFNPEPENSRQQISLSTSTRSWLVTEETGAQLKLGQVKWAPSVGIHPNLAAMKFLDNFSVSTSRFWLTFPSSGD